MHLFKTNQKKVTQETRMNLPEGLLENADKIRVGVYGVTCIDAKMTENGSLLIQMRVDDDPNVNDAPEGYISQEGEFLSDFIDVDMEQVKSRLKDPSKFPMIKKMIEKKTASCFNGFGIGANFEPDDFINKQAWAVLGGRMNKSTGEELEEIKSYRSYEA